ncbi:MAG: nickel-dependent hydrogenase large subunit [Siculibacillus sp.]|nr:nickel-dependent hydrogenase large subunit [Siculibacillus sp.]
MSLRAALFDAALEVFDQKPWPRIRVDEETWIRAIFGLHAGDVILTALWGEPGHVHMGLIEEETGEVLVLSLACPDGRFPSVGVTHAPALRLERTLREMVGLVPDGCPDDRPWLDHSRWGLRHPLGAAEPAPAEGAPYAFLSAEGPPMHQIPVGPVHAGIIEPGHFRFTANGETVIRLEERLGWVHKGIEGLMIGADLDRAAALAARVSGDSTVAWSLAFARAVEAAVGIAVPKRAHWLRALMAEMERVANHLGDVGAVCNDAAFSQMLNRCGQLRERVLRAADVAFGHRLMMDRVVPGGTGVDLVDPRPIAETATAVREGFRPLIHLYDNTVSLLDRTVTTGRLDPALARRWGAGGHVGRACGRRFDSRRLPGYPPYDVLRFDVPVRETGDVDARVWVRILEIGESLKLIEQILAGLPAGPHRVEVDAAGAAGREGVAMTEAFRGDSFIWLRLDAEGRIARAHFRDASVFQWPLLEAAIAHNIVADFPLLNKSFNCSYSGHDL